MKTLCMDSAHKHLIIVLLEDHEVKAGIALPCWKHQSEMLFPQLIACFEELNWSVDDLDEVVITDGPGSYTGVRIAMTVAKVLCTRKQIPLYCVSTLQLYAGLKEHVMVMLDARSNRAYVGLLHMGEFVKEECIMPIPEIKTYLLQHPEVTVLGDCECVDLTSESIDFVQNFNDIYTKARKMENIHIVTPRYLKEQDAYKAG